MLGIIFVCHCSGLCCRKLLWSVLNVRIGVGSCWFGLVVVVTLSNRTWRGVELLESGVVCLVRFCQGQLNLDRSKEGGLVGKGCYCWIAEGCEVGLIPSKP